MKAPYGPSSLLPCSSPTSSPGALVAALIAPASARTPLYFDAGRAGVEDATRAVTLARLDAIGVRALRVVLVWGAVAPDAGSALCPAFNDAALSGFQSGLITATGHAKPSLDELRLPLTARRSGTSVLLRGLVRPATGGTSTRVEVLVRDRTDARSSVAANASDRRRRHLDGAAGIPSGTHVPGALDSFGRATYEGSPVRVYG